MMTVEENRKKVRRTNLLISLLFLMMIIGVSGAIYYYSNLKKAKIEVQQQKQEVETLKDTLAKQNSRLLTLLDFVDSVNQLKIKLDKTFLEQNPNNEFAIRQNDLNNILQPVIFSRDSARQHARDGYDRLIKKDFTGAMEEFDKSEKAYNGYHESYEIYKLLKENKDKLNDPATQRQLLIKIKNDYNSLQKLNTRNIQ